MQHTINVPSQVHNVSSVSPSPDRLRLLRLPLLIALVTMLCAMAAASDWAWHSGSGMPSRDPVYGAIGTPTAETTPGARTGSATWTDAAGNLWLFGGTLHGTNQNGLCNDLWKYTPATNQWTWIKGNNFTDFIGIYGTKGTSAPDNNPGSRHLSASWIDATGSLWLFGGIGYDATGPTYPLNDLWKFDPSNSQWTWMAGSKTSRALGTYGTQGAEASANTPGARASSAFWKDANGFFWLFGGEGYSVGSGRGLLNDLWKLNPSNGQWTWIGGTTDKGELATTGIQGESAPANLPGGLSAASSWTDSSGNLWLFGGFGYSDPFYADWLNDLWKYNPSTNLWTWVSGNYGGDPGGTYGTMGVAHSDNIPGGRSGSGGWADTSGNLWIYGGIGYAESSSSLVGLGDLWIYSPTADRWTWVAGNKEGNTPPIHADKGTPSSSSKPGSRSDSQYWKLPSGDIYLYSGEITMSDSTQLYWPDMWKLNPATRQWTWLTGPQAAANSGVYNTQATPDATSKPGARTDASGWHSADRTLWMMGGQGYDSHGKLGLMNDVWQYNTDTSTWTWMKGSDQANPNGLYGTKTIPNPNNTPSGRRNSITWTDPTGNFWLLGGETLRYISGTPGIILRNDLWMFNPVSRQWAWMAGGNLNQDRGVYGTLETPTTATTPGAREGGYSWVDASGNLWLFGGRSTSEASASTGIINDLWKFSPSTLQWTWMGGSKSNGAYGTYGIQGAASTTYIPGARRDGACWTDADGNFWLMGGYGYGESGYTGELNDLWKYTPATKEWAWMHGSKQSSANAIYGTQGESAPANTPGGRISAATWKDDAGNLYLFGGDSMLTTGNFSTPTDDLWQYNPQNNQWTWLKGSNQGEITPIAGPATIPLPANTPGSRRGMVSWSKSNNEFWLFGGEAQFTAEYNDLWLHKIEVPMNAAQDWQLFH